MTTQQKNTLYQTLASGFLMLGTGIVMLSPQIPLIRKVSEYSVHIMLGLLGFSILAMALNKTKIMFAGLACTAAMCIFLKDASNNTLKLPQANTEAKVNVAHINLSNIESDISDIKNLLDSEQVELISFQELTPDWNSILKDQLITDYPYSKSEVRIDPYGMAIYSKYPFSSTHIFDCKGKPNIQIAVQKEKQNFLVISSYLTPALDRISIEKATEELDIISERILSVDEPVIALGEYNMVYWTNEIRNFRSKSNLTNSRRGLSDGNLRVPYGHIFFSEGLECTQFKELKDEKQAYVGIVGTYQIKGEEKHKTLNSQLSLNEK